MIRRPSELGRAVGLRQKGNYRGAAKLLQRATASGNTHPLVVDEARQIPYAAEYDAAKALLSAARTADAEAALRKITERFPLEPPPRLLLATVLRVCGASDEAAAEARRAVEAAPHDPVTLFRAANILRLQDRQTARLWLDRAIAAMRPYDVVIARADVANLDGFLAMGERRPGVGVALLEEAVDEAPGDPAIAADLAQAYVFLERFDDAKQLITDVLREHPVNSRLNDLLRRAGGNNRR